MQTGDTLVSFQGQANSVKRIINVGTIKLWDEIPRKSMIIECTSDSISSDTTVWIEGMGDVDRLFWTKSYCSEEDAYVEIRNIRCFLVNKQAIFSRPDLEDCFLTSVDDLNTESIEVYPNPVFETLHFKIEVTLALLKFFSTNSIGQIVLSSNKLSSDHALDVSSFPLEFIMD
jgi:hypothetical protein